MPNGHGGIPRFGSPFLVIVMMAVLLRLRFSLDASWTVYPAYVGAAVFGWRFAWHLWMYDLMEYGGSYSSVEELAQSTRRYWLTALVTVPVSLALVYLFWP